MDVLLGVLCGFVLVMLLPWKTGEWLKRHAHRTFTEPISLRRHKKDQDDASR